MGARVAANGAPQSASLSPQTLGCRSDGRWTESAESIWRSRGRQSGCKWTAFFVSHFESTGVRLQVRRALDWLRGERQESRRYAAVLILRQMALNAPAVFNVHVRAFIDVIWTGLRDPKLHIRESAVDALRVRHSSSFGVDPVH